jgi:hypothetical protein
MVQVHGCPERERCISDAEKKEPGQGPSLMEGIHNLMHLMLHKPFFCNKIYLTREIHWGTEYRTVG